MKNCVKRHENLATADCSTHQASTPPNVSHDLSSVARGTGGELAFQPAKLAMFQTSGKHFQSESFLSSFHLSNIFNLLFWARIFTNTVSLVAKDLPLKHGQGQLTSVALNATWAQPGIHLGPEVINSDLIKLWHGLIIQIIYEEFTFKKFTDVMYIRNPMRL